MRFTRMGEEKRDLHLGKVCEIAQQVFISEGNPDVTELLIAESGDWETGLYSFEMFDQVFKSKGKNLLKINRTGEDGFNKAIETLKSSLEQNDLAIQRKSLSKFFLEI